MTRVYRVALPENSLLRTGIQPDYSDSYQAVVQPASQSLTPADLGKAFFAASPPWVDYLFSLRNKLVGLFGLKVPDTQNRQQQIARFTATPGEKAGLFRVFSGQVNELILGENDKHLDFRVSLLLEDRADQPFEKVLTVTTTVYVHNRMGRLYFIPVKPFHRLIVPVMLKAMIRKLSKYV